MTLSRVIQALSLPKQQQPKHISYRDSKLTRILQHHLSGNACLTVLCCVSASKRCLEETRSTLKFAANAKLVKVKPAVNEVVDEGVVRKNLEKELAVTKEALFQLRELIRQGTLGFLPANRDDRSAVTTLDVPSEIVVGEGVPELNNIIDSSEASNEDPPVKAIDVPEDVLQKGGDDDAVAKLKVVGQKVKFLEDKLEATDGLVDRLSGDLQNMQMCNDELTSINLELAAIFAGLDEREFATSEDIQLMRQQSKLQVLAFLFGFVFLLNGHTDLFLATVVFLWLSLEVVTF